MTPFRALIQHAHGQTVVTISTTCFFQWSTQNPDLCEHDVVLVVRDKEVSSLLVYHTSRFTSFQGHRSNTPICKHTTHAAKRLDTNWSTVNSRWPGRQIVARWLLKSDFALVHLYLSCPSGERELDYREWIADPTSGKDKATEGENWAPPFTCCAQETMGL